jgi:radical SAM superfamily enzyme YgiQ (UPF0313 family)
MRILLIVPTHRYKVQYPSFLSITDFPVGFAYLASALGTAGHAVFGLNPNNDPGYDNAHQMLRAKIISAVNSIQPDLICTGGLCTDYAFLKDTLGILRELVSGIPIVLGGGIITNDAEYVFRNLRPDFCIVGEAEEVLVQLAQTLENGSNRYEDIPNLGYWQNSMAKFTQKDFHYIDLDQRVFPDYEPFGIKEMLDQYSMASRYLYRYTRLNPRPMTIVTGRSCPFNCTFCVHQRGIKYRARKIDNILKEISYLYSKYQFNILIILDELFAVNKTRLRDFSEAILQGRRDIGWDFHWIFQTHASASFDQETLTVARRAGCYCFAYGLESASPTVLASMNKRTKQSQIIGAIKAADRAQIGFGGNFIFGDVAETWKTTGESMRFFKEYCRDIHIYFGWIQPYPGSKLFDYCLEKKIIQDKLQFYEHIDEQLFNMTTMPSFLWKPWMIALMYLGNLFLWVKTTDAISCQKVAELDGNPISLPYSTQLYEISAICPFCGQKFCCREDLGSQKIKHTFSFSFVQSTFFKYFGRLRKSRWFFALFYFGIYLVSLWQVPFKQLLYLRERSHTLAPSIVTGCPNCNKRLRVNLKR